MTLASAILDEEVEAVVKTICKLNYWTSGESGVEDRFCLGPHCPCWRPRLKLCRQALEAAAAAREALDAG